MLDPQLLFLLLMLGLLFLMFSRSRKQQKAQQQMLSSLAPGTEIMTASGMFATVVAIEGEEMVLEVAPGVRTRWTRRAVARVITPVAAPADGLAGDTDTGGVHLSKDRAARPATGEDRPQL